MRGLLVLIVGGLGLGAFWRRFRRRPAPEGWPGEFGPDPAEELRSKLAESKATPEEPGEERKPEAPEAGPLSPLDPEVRRRGVHERARASLDELK